VPKYKEGDLVLCFEREFGGQQLKPLAWAESIEKVGSRFYTLAGRSYSRRESFGKLESRSLGIPRLIPWSFPEDFSAFCYLLPIAYCHRLWSIYEVGHPFVRKFEKIFDSFSGETYKRPADIGFNPCGYAVRQIDRRGKDSWTWPNTRAEVLAKLIEAFRLAEESAPTDGIRLPEYLEEEGKKQWEGLTSPGDARSLRPGDIFCEGDLNSGFSFYTVERFTKSGKLVTTQMRPPRELRPVSLPTAFPQEILGNLGGIGHLELFDEARIWVAHKRLWPLTSEQEETPPSDLPGGGMTIGGMVGRWMDRAALYYSNDRIRWWRRLSRALEYELDRLRFVYPGGIPGLQ